MSAIEELEEEHKLILQMIKALSTLQPAIEKGKIDPDALTPVVDFFRTYADKFHHAKEEAKLFPMLEKRGVRPSGCPIGVLHSEHEQGRVLITALSDSIEKYKHGDPATRAAIGVIRQERDQLLHRAHLERRLPAISNEQQSSDAIRSNRTPKKFRQGRCRNGLWLSEAVQSRGRTPSGDRNQGLI